MRFTYHPQIAERYPYLVGGVIAATHITAVPSPELDALYQAEQQAVIARIGDTPLSEIPSLAAWRSAFRAFGVDPTQYRSAAEALLRRLTKKGDIPSINPLVDMGNLVSIRYGLPVAVVDARGFDESLLVRFADGDELFTNLGTSEPEHPEAGEVIFSDPNKQVAARRWCWRQSEQSAARMDTSAALITVEAHHTNAEADIRAAVADLETLFRAYAGASCVSGVLRAASGVLGFASV